MSTRRMCRPGPESPTANKPSTWGGGAGPAAGSARLPHAGASRPDPPMLAGMVQIDPTLIRWSHDEADRAGRPLLVLLHGVGSHEGDLHRPRALPPPRRGHRLAPGAPRPRRRLLVVPACRLRGNPTPAPSTTPPAPYSSGSRRWRTRIRPRASSASRRADRCRCSCCDTPPTRSTYAIVLAGFVVPTIGDDVDAQARDEVLAGLRPPVFYGRGDVDEVIPAAAVERTSEWLEQHTDAEQTVYPGLAHGVSQRGARRRQRLHLAGDRAGRADGVDRGLARRRRVRHAPPPCRTRGRAPHDRLRRRRPRASGPRRDRPAQRRHRAGDAPSAVERRDLVDGAERHDRAGPRVGNSAGGTGRLPIPLPGRREVPGFRRPRVLDRRPGRS